MTHNRIAAVAATVVLLAVTLSHSAYGQSVLKSGTFRGAGGHKSSGQVSIVNADGVTKVVFAKNFRLNGAPDPRVAFGNGRYVRGTIFAKLRKLKGAQEYVVPSSFDLSKYNQVWLWCKKFNAPLAVARVR